MQDVDRNVLVSLLRRLRGMDESARRLRIAREKSLNERDSVKRPAGHGLLFCVHNRHFFTPCTTCKRTQSEANRKREVYLSKHA